MPNFSALGSYQASPFWAASRPHDVRCRTQGSPAKGCSLLMHLQMFLQEIPKLSPLAQLPKSALCSTPKTQQSESDFLLENMTDRTLCRRRRYDDDYDDNWRWRSFHFQDSVRRQLLLVVSLFTLPGLAWKDRSKIDQVWLVSHTSSPGPLRGP